MQEAELIGQIKAEAEQEQCCQQNKHSDNAGEARVALFLHGTFVEGARHARFGWCSICLIRLGTGHRAMIARRNGRKGLWKGRVTLSRAILALCQCAIGGSSLAAVALRHLVIDKLAAGWRWQAIAGRS